MFARHSAAVRELLQEQGLVDAARLAELEAEHHATGRPLAELAIERGAVQRAELLRWIAEWQGCEFVREFPEQFSGEAIAVLRGELAREYGVMPWRVGERHVDVLMGDPFELERIDELRFALGRDVRCFCADPAQVEIKIRQHYGGGEGAELAENLEELGADAAAAVGNAAAVRDLEALATQTPVIRFVNLVLARAVREGASDVHFEPFEREFKIRYRVDGALFEMPPPPTALALPVVSRIKVLANLNIAERRVPQDGRLGIRVDDRTVDLRVSTLPTQFGESVVLRVLDQAALRLEIAELGMPEGVLRGVRELVRRPNGIFIVTGPTGSGKTTTLYSGLRLINRTDLKILTAEDPIEYEIEGIMQMAVNPTIGLTFATALRSFLRQDPDVIMVGEIRDLETAEIAIQASLTGHLVLTTLHTNDAAGAVTRLVDMGVEPFLIASTLEAVLAQRLVRRVCRQCREPYEPAPELLVELGFGAAAAREQTFWQGHGCPACNGSGYRGRLGIYEWLPVNDAVRERVSRCAPTLELREEAMRHGMQTLREAGVRAVIEGHTTVEEVVKCT